VLTVAAIALLEFGLDQLTLRYISLISVIWLALGLVRFLNEPSADHSPIHPNIHELVIRKILRHSNVSTTTSY
jgi:hypothetical protein